ncbi:uncharacterized protein LOC122006251 isoform X2 [Zingiber officinale]|uniref:Uncharacterized protein n=1 Tax=Zingiber officinale TaxID=94328 RepID=A0A8J5KRI2_ZINOF|nr:uncharacterized protein LOC122006251 isoform X2 [Zingiber officinale]KAG6490204.1 hypothetical protein ZIOFF_051489 [Zingiber officinale]
MSAVASRYGKDDDDPLRDVARTTTPFVLWRGMPTAPRAATRMPTAASRSGPKVASPDHEDARNCLTRGVPLVYRTVNDLHPLAIVMDGRDQMPPTEMALD